MDTPIENLRERATDNWLIGYDSTEFLHLTEALFQELSYPIHQNILIAESNPIDFLACFIAACSRGHHVFLGNPTWGSSEWEQVFNLAKIDRIYSDCEYAQQLYITSQFNNHNPITPEHQINSDECLIMIPTGGSSGKIRFAMHTWKTLTASARGFCKYFQFNEVNSICLLPLFHVSGLMQFIRSFTSGGQLLIAPFKELKSGKLCSFEPNKFSISLVPTQLQHILNDNSLAHWLARCQIVLLGGAPAWSELLEKARFHKIKLSTTYGMTETASQIATLKPHNFLDGDNSNGQALPHAQIYISTETTENSEILCNNKTGKIAIQSTSLALGYYPEPFQQQEIFYTDDIGYFDNSGNLNIVCRSSDKIITGGENVYPCEVEAAIRATDLVTDVVVVGLPDSYWGQIIAAIYTPCCASILSEEIQDAINGKLTRYKRPKLWIPVTKMPRNEQGKVNRQQLYQIAIAQQQVSEI